MRRRLRTPSVGEIFGSWTVVVPGVSTCLCRCICGVEKSVLKRNKFKSEMWLMENEYRSN